MIDAARKIYASGGVGALYRGFWVSSVSPIYFLSVKLYILHLFISVYRPLQPQIVSGIFYISTYEGVRHVLGLRDFNLQIKVCAYFKYVFLKTDDVIRMLYLHF